MTESESRLNMADVGAKASSMRRAVARGDLLLGPEAYGALRQRKLPKGDALAVAEVAAILAAKRTPETIPLCHPLALDFVGVTFEWPEGQYRVRCRCEVRCRGVTGVEMEALAGVTAALLSLWDLCKPIDAALNIENVFLELKEGGKSGLWQHPRVVSDSSGAPVQKQPLRDLVVGVLTVSDSVSQGTSPDVSGPTLVELCRKAGATSVESGVVADDVSQIREGVLRLLKSCSVVLTTGGTGIGPRDVTPEALRSLGGRELVGMGELLRSSGAAFTKTSWLSRSLAIVIEGGLVVAFPGKPAAVREGFDAVADLVAHALAMVRGGGHGGRGGSH